MLRANTANGWFPARSVTSLLTPLTLLPKTKEGHPKVTYLVVVLRASWLMFFMGFAGISAHGLPQGLTKIPHRERSANQKLRARKVRDPEAVLYPVLGEPFEHLALLDPNCIWTHFGKGYWVLSNSATSR